MEFRLDNREEDLFHEIFLEELNVKSESKNCPLVSEIELRPKNLTFHVNSDVFVIKRLEFVFKLVSFAHCQMLEIFLHVKNCEALDRFMSFSFYLDFEGEKPQSCIVTVNNSYKNDYFIQKFNVKYPKTLKIRGRYEKTHSKLFKKLLGIRKIKVSESANILDSQKLEMLLQSSRFCVESEDEVLFLLGEWCNTNYVSEETLKILLSLVRWDFVTLFALLEALKFTVLKSTSHFKTIFKQEMCYKSGTALRPLSSSPRINYKPLNTDLSLTNFLEATTKILLNSKNENTAEIEELTGKLLTNSSKLEKIKFKLNSMQNSLNSSICQQTTSITPVPDQTEKPRILKSYQNSFTYSEKPAKKANLSIPASTRLSLLHSRLSRIKRFSN